MAEDRERRQSGRRVTVDEAARHYGLTVDAIRKRVQRKKIPHEKDAAGRVRIILDESETLQDESPDNTGQRSAQDVRGELVEELRDRVRYLEKTLDEEREARTEERRRNDTVLAQLSAANAEQARTIRELEAPQEASESPETVEEAPDRADPHPAADPGPARATLIFMVATWVVVGSVPLLLSFLEATIYRAFQYSSEGESYARWANVAYLLLVLPFIFGVYRGHWNRRRTEFAQQNRNWNEAHRKAYLGNVGAKESLVALATVGGAAILSIALAVVAPSEALIPAILVIIGTFFFYVFAVLIGLSIGGHQSSTGGGGLGSATGSTPQLILGLLGAIITAIATVIAASIGG